jgi:hypothetical protein
MIKNPEGKESREKEILEKRMAKNFLKIVKYIKAEIQKSYRTLSKNDTHPKSISTHHIKTSA